MSANAFYFIGLILVVFLIGFVGFYFYRLGSARKQSADDPSARLEQLLREARLAATQAPVGAAESEAPSLRGEGRDLSTGAAPAERVVARSLGLRAITSDSVFMRLDKDGVVSFQIGDKPPMPLKFLLDARTRGVLDGVARQATADFGRTWAILASEDEEGRLTMVRLA